MRFLKHHIFEAFGFVRFRGSFFKWSNPIIFLIPPSYPIHFAEVGGVAIRTHATRVETWRGWQGPAGDIAFAKVFAGGTSLDSHDSHLLVY